MLEFRSLFLSDVHLGTPDCQADYLLDLLRGTRAATLYLVGDILDLEALARRAYWPAAHARVLAEIVALAARGTRVVYLPGNHDAALRGLCGGLLAGVEVQRQAVHVAADGRRYRVSHGDEFDPGHAGRRWLTWIGERSHRGLRWCNRHLAHARRRVGLPYLPLSIVTKSRLAAAMAFIEDFQQRVAQDCAQAGFDGHICGHIHYGCIRRIGDVLYMNDGDWVEHCTALAEDAHGTMHLLHWSERPALLASSGAESLQAPLAFAALAAQTAPLAA